MYRDELKPVALDQFMHGQNGRMILIESDVGSVVQQIQEINPNFCVRVSEIGGYFVVFHRDPDTHKEKLITTAEELDHRLLKRVQKISSPLYNYVDEVDRLDKAAEKDREDKFSESIGEAGEKLAHALRKDTGVDKDSARSKQSWGKGLVGR